jgi:hypothetical protein
MPRSLADAAESLAIAKVSAHMALFGRPKPVPPAQRPPSKYRYDAKLGRLVLGEPEAPA